MRAFEICRWPTQHLTTTNKIDRCQLALAIPRKGFHDGLLSGGIFVTVAGLPPACGHDLTGSFRGLAGAHVRQQLCNLGPARAAIGTGTKNLADAFDRDETLLLNGR